MSEMRCLNSENVAHQPKYYIGGFILCVFSIQSLETEFVSSLELNWRNLALHHSAVNGCCQTESKQLIKTSQ